MNPENGKILAVFLAGLGLLLLSVSNLMFQFNKKKAVAATVLSVIFLAVAGYYLYLAYLVPSPTLMSVSVGVQAEKPAGGPKVEAPAPPAREESSLSMLLDVDGQRFSVENEDEIQIKKSSKFTIREVQANPPIPGLKANIVGFVANPRNNDGQDANYTVSYNKLEKRRALKGNVFKVEFRDKNKVYGEVFLKFVD